MKWLVVATIVAAVSVTGVAKGGNVSAGAKKREPLSKSTTCSSPVPATCTITISMYRTTPGSVKIHASSASATSVDATLKCAALMPRHHLYKGGKVIDLNWSVASPDAFGFSAYTFINKQKACSLVLKVAGKAPVRAKVAWYARSTIFH